MQETISYEDRYEMLPLKETELNSMDSYYQVYRQDGRIKKKELRRDGCLVSSGFEVGLIYYRDAAETESEAIRTILSAYKLGNFEIRERRRLGEYTIIQAKAFDGKGTFEDFTVTELYDGSERLVYEKTESCFKGIEEVEVSKHLYDYEEHPWLEFRYGAGSAFYEIRGSLSPFSSFNDHAVKPEEVPLFFPRLLQQHPYYRTADQTLPVAPHWAF